MNVIFLNYRLNYHLIISLDIVARACFRSSSHSLRSIR